MNPVRDLDIISEELRLKDVEFLNTHLEKLEKLVIRGNDKKLKPEYVNIQRIYFGRRISWTKKVVLHKSIFMKIAF